MKKTGEDSGTESGNEEAMAECLDIKKLRIYRDTLELLNGIQKIKFPSVIPASDGTTIADINQ
jgi:hypothetical protein